MSASTMPKPVVLINTFTVKPGKMDEFLALQRAALEQFRGRIPGWRGGRLHRALDGNTAVMMSVFESADAHRRFLETPGFDAHRARVLPLIEDAQPVYYEVVHESGLL
jgi:quinol monooxygenase YgiN